MSGPGKLTSPMVSGKALDTKIQSVADVTTAGLLVRVTGWAPTALLQRIMVAKTAGDATLFNVEIYDKRSSPGTLNCMYKRTGLTTLLDDNDNPVEIFNQEGYGENELYVKIIPNAGINNDFDIRGQGYELEFIKL